MKHWKAILIAVALVALPGFSYSQSPAPLPAVYVFDVNSAASMRGYFILRGYEFFEGAPAAIYRSAVRTCGNNPVFVGTAVHPDQPGKIFNFCRSSTTEVLEAEAQGMCRMLSQTFERDLPLVRIDGSEVYCGELREAA